MGIKNSEILVSSYLMLLIMNKLATPATHLTKSLNILIKNAATASITHLTKSLDTTPIELLCNP